MRIELISDGRLEKFAANCTKWGQAGVIDRALRGAVKEAARPAVPALQAAVRSTRVRGNAGSTGLRGRIANAAVLRESRDAITIAVDGGRMPSGEMSLPAMFDGKKRWRHPVYGNRGVWVQQKSHPFFTRTVRPYKEAAKKAFTLVAAKIMRDIEHGGRI